MSFLNTSLTELLIRIPVVLTALIVHEIAHGYMAYRLGDPTARNFGRLSMNPLKHLDPIGTLCMLLFKFGWAKPVPINARYFKNPRRDMALTALAGPVANFILGFIGVTLYFFSSLLITINVTDIGFIYNLKVVWLTFLQVWIYLNVYLGVFNMIPVPPLDGSRIFLTFLPPKYYFGIMKYERYIMIGLLIALYLGVLGGVIGFVGDLVIDLMFKPFVLIAKLFV
ncbi:MAG: site-2 protease family protein [Clostridia bacterium]|nr:site-2 protease family protein [Clostridia bacterium]MBR5447187.1 site-2 protease family protein [Clostridia bacterium]MBR5633375.1 site-2 protease family protein [Clostridia bacterium]